MDTVSYGVTDQMCKVANLQFSVNKNCLKKNNYDAFNSVCNNIKEIENSCFSKLNDLPSVISNLPCINSY